MKKYFIAGAVIIILAALVAINLLKKEKGVDVTTEKVELGSVQQTVTGSGQIKPAIEVKISAQVAGKIVQLSVKEGDRVPKGMLLVALDPTQYQASVERAESYLMASRANEKKANSDLKRADELYAKTLISEAELESAQAGYESAVSSRMQSEAALKEAKDALSKTRLFATMDGVVTRLNKEIGEMAIGAQFQEDVIMVVSDLAVMEAVIEVDENDIINISLHDSADVELDAFQDTTFKGIVTEIANSAITKGLGTQEQVTNFEVTITLDNPDNRFRPGMSTTVDIKTNRLDNVLRVPIQSVTVRDAKKLEEKKDERDSAKVSVQEDDEEKDMREVVFIVTENRTVAKQVKLGISDDRYYSVLSGISEGDQVVTGPFKLLNKDLKNDQLVSVKETKKGKK